MGIKAAIEEICVLSPMQQGMLFHTLEAPGSGVYVTQLRAELEGLNEGAFREAWSQVVQRHGVLRTGFVWEGVAEPLQVVERGVKLAWEEEDWRGLSGEEQKEKLEQYLKADRVRGFDVSKAPLMRLSLIRTGEERFQLLWSHHHLLMDGWSVPVVLSEVMRFYEANCAGKVERL